MPDGWLAAAVNRGWIYRDRIAAPAAGLTVCDFYAGRYRHSGRGIWRQRLAAGQIERNGHRLAADEPLAAGDRLAWHRPPWREEAVPARWSVIHDDGDLLVIDKPAGLPVLPAGGWLEHTVLRLLERRHAGDPGGVPRPVHRLGRFTSGLLVCARRPATRSWLSALLRESTGALAGAGLREGEGAHTCPEAALAGGCRKIYRALVAPGRLALAIGGSLRIGVPIGRREHPLLGRIWCAVDGSCGDGLPSFSCLTLRERGVTADLVEAAIASGRPHQIRIHCAAVGAPLLGDPLYGPGGVPAPDVRPGEGGYRLQAWRLELPVPGGSRLELQAPHPLPLAPGL